jgi:conjugal transfer pilus assembly protein TraU
MKLHGVMGVFFVLLSLNLQAGICHGHFANPITDVCWSCLFPLSIGSGKVVSSGNPDTPNPGLPVCACGAPVPRIGISLGYWEPIALVDVTRLPFCMVNVAGSQFNTGASYPMGSQQSHQGGLDSSFYEAHWYTFPLMTWLHLLTNVGCLELDDFGILYLTELDPTWHDDELAFILNPEAILFANPIAQAACAADSIAATTGNGPINALFWCAGSQGSMYPLSGRVQEHVGGVQASTLLTERMAYQLHRKWLLWDSAGVDGPALCMQHPTPILPKNRYRYQMTYPVPSVARGVLGCRPLGAGTFTWEAGHERPVKGEDFGYLVWRKRNCCVL